MLVANEIWFDLIMFFKPDLDQLWHFLSAFQPSLPVNKTAAAPVASPLQRTTPTSRPRSHCVSWGKIHLCFQVDVQATSEAFISKAKVVSRAGSLCEAGRWYPQRELLPRAEVTRDARNTDAFSWWQHCRFTANYCASPQYFYFEPFFTLEVWNED